MLLVQQNFQHGMSRLPNELFALMNIIIQERGNLEVCKCAKNVVSPQQARGAHQVQGVSPKQFDTTLIKHRRNLARTRRTVMRTQEHLASVGWMTQQLLHTILSRGSLGFQSPPVERATTWDAAPTSLSQGAGS